MVGRKRKTAPRYPNGDLRPAGEPIVPAAWARIRTEAARLTDDQRLSSEIGRLSFHREITDMQAATAFRVADIYNAFERARELRRSSRSPSYERGFGRGGDNDELVTREQMEQLLDDDPLKKKMLAAIAAHENFWALQKELTGLTTAQRHMLEGLCCDNRFLTREELVTVREILDYLALRIGSSTSKKKARRAERNARLKPAKAAAPATRSAPRQTSPKTLALQTLLKSIRPDLDDAGIREACRLMDALEDRERMRTDKKKRPPRGAAAQSGENSHVAPGAGGD